MMQPEAIKIRLGGMIKSKSNTITARVEGICDMSAPAPKPQGPLNSQEGEQQQNLPLAPKQNVEAMTVLASNPSQ